MKRKIIFLVNPVSGTSKKDTVLKQIEASCKKEKIHFEIMDTNAAGNYSIIKHKIHEEHITDIIVIGGDGTVNQVVHALRNEPVKFGIIPFGSGNGFAFALGGQQYNVYYDTGSSLLRACSSAWDGCGTLNSADRVISFSAAAVPEPATYGLMGLGLAVVALARSRRRAAHAG